MLEYKGYTGRVVFDDEADLFHGELVGLRDVVTFQGQSSDELRQAFQESVEDYLEFCQERGEAPNAFAGDARLFRRPVDGSGGITRRKIRMSPIRWPTEFTTVPPQPR